MFDYNKFLIKHLPYILIIPPVVLCVLCWTIVCHIWQSLHMLFNGESAKSCVWETYLAQLSKGVAMPENETPCPRCCRLSIHSALFPFPGPCSHLWAPSCKGVRKTTSNPAPNLPTMAVLQKSRVPFYSLLISTSLPSCSSFSFWRPLQRAGRLLDWSMSCFFLKVTSSVAFFWAMEKFPFPQTYHLF